MMHYGRYGGPFLAGVLSHLAYFHEREHHLFITLYVKCFALAVFSLALVLPSFGDAFIIGVCFLSGIYFTLFTHRLLLHPLNVFPGSFWARVSNFWLPFRFRARDGFSQIQDLHQKHGQFVRLGPNYLSIAHPRAVDLLHGRASQCIKAPWYDLNLPIVSMMTYRNKSLHDERRRIWSKAFGDPSIRSYEQRATVYQQKLMAHITGLKGKPVNITRLFHLFTFDVMGDFAFGKSFGLLDAQEFGITQLLRTALIPLGFSFPVWFLRVLVAIPGATKDWWKFMDFCAGRLKNRLDSSVKTADITSALSLPLAGKQPTKAEWDLLTGDAQLIVIAGSDTTASTLSAMIFELVKSPRHIEILRQEVAPYMQASGEVLNQDITHLEHLNAVINETLRLHPPVPTALQRKTPPEGITVGETYIPGNTTVICPQYVMGRSEEIYERASEFVPERWTTRPEMITENDVFVPFSSGPYGCIGKHLALSIIRTTISKILTTFDLSLGPGEDGRRFERDAKESFVMSFGDLDICFEERV